MSILVEPLDVIVVAYDGSTQAKKALQIAKEFRSKFGSKIYVIHVIDVATLITDPSACAQVEAELEKRAQKLAEEAKAFLKDAEVRIVRGDPAHEIVEFAKQVNASLIIVGSRGLSTLKRVLLGSVSSRVVHESPISVLVVK